MKKRLVFVIFLFISFFYSFAGNSDYFENKTLRIDYFHSGNDTLEFYSIDELKEESLWGGSLSNLTDTFNYGHYKFVAYDKASGKIRKITLPFLPNGEQPMKQRPLLNLFLKPLQCLILKQL